MAQLSQFPIHDGGRGMFVCSDSVMLFGDGALYSKSLAQQNWNRIDSSGNWAGVFALDGAVMYNLISKNVGINSLYYSTEINVSYDKGLSWQNLVPSTKMDSSYYGLSFFAADSLLYFSSQSGNIFKYDLLADTLLPLYVRPPNSLISLQNFKLFDGKVYFHYSDILYRVDTLNQLDSITATYQGLYQNSFAIENNKIAIVASTGNYFSTDSGNTWLLDSSATYDSISTTFNNRVVTVHQGVFYSVTSNYLIGNYKQHMAIFSYSIDGNHWIRDSLFFYQINGTATVFDIQISNNRIFLNTTDGVYEYDTLQHQFLKHNAGIKENRIHNLATNANFHVIQDRFSVYVRNLSSGMDEDITAFLPSLNDTIRWNYAYLKTSFSITTNNKIYFQIGAADVNLWNDKLFVSVDLGHTWRLVDTAVVLNYFATNDSLFYATDQKLYRSFNAGISATEVSNIQSPPSVFTCMNKDRHYIQGKNNVLYLTTCQTWLQGQVDYLLYYSDDFGETWKYEKTFNYAPTILQNAAYDFGFDGGCYKKNRMDSIWNQQNNLQISLLFNNAMGGYLHAFKLGNKYYLSRNASAEANGKIVFYEVDNSCNFAFPIYQTSQFQHQAMKIKEENNILSLVPGVSASCYFLYSDSTSVFRGLASGKVLYDSNHNALVDSSDSPFPGAIISNRYNGSMSNASGYYFIPLTQALDTFYAHTDQKYSTISPASLQAHPNDSTLIFLVCTQPGITDLAIHASVSAAPRPGFKYTTYLTCKNEGTTYPYFTVKYIQTSGTINIKTEPPASSVSSDTLLWNVVNFTFAPMQTYTITIEDSIASTDSIGGMLASFAEISTTASDTFPADNTTALNIQVRGAIDPNEKAVEPQYFTSNNVNSGDYLTYTLRFQNTGTAPAFYVMVEDTLSPLLDITTLQTISASSNYFQSIKEGNVISYFFNAIQLPDSSSNESGSHGFVSFKIKPKPTWNVGDSICNTAYIYFDFNSPAATNTVCSNLILPNLIAEVNTSKEGLLYPNPAHNFIYLPSGGNIISCKIYNSMRQLVHGSSKPTTQAIDVSGLTNGIYFMELINSEKTEWKMFIKQ